MNGFEPLRRRITDYTAAGQWQEVYDGPIEECEEYRLKAENAKLRELVRDMWNGMCGYGHDCRSCEHYELCAGQRLVGECEYHRRMRELGIEVNDA